MKVRMVSYTKPVLEELQNTTNSSEIMNIISFCGRVSNPKNQERVDTAERLIKYLKKHKHWSPFEMADITFEIETTRDIARQIIRHKSAFFQEFCLSGDTEIYFAVPSKYEKGFYRPSYKMKLSDLYDKWQNGAKPIPHKNSGAPIRIPMKDRMKNMLIKCYDEDTKQLTATNIKEIFYTGKKPLYKVTLSDGKVIKTTKEHKFLTKEGGFDTLENIVGLTMKNNIATMSIRAQVGVSEWRAMGREARRKNAYTVNWVDVVSVEYLGEEDTYDIEVDHPSHNYIANGIVVHNSQRYANPLEQGLEFVLREARLQDTENRQNSIEIVEDSEISKEWVVLQQKVIGVVTEVYERALELGIAKEVARAVLPEGLTPSRMYMKASIRTWIHFLEVRTGVETQKEHRLIALAIADAIKNVFGDIL
jgi:thymidylate synthase ThyX